MKQKLLIFLVVFLVGAILIGLNVASYTQKPKTADTELSPNRSSFHSGSTGTQAFYALLSESGRKVVRWQEPPEILRTVKKNAPTVFVVIGSLRKEYSQPEIDAVLEWVSAGGRLVLIDREPPDGLIQTTSDWRIAMTPSNLASIIDADPSDQPGMISGTAAAKPGQPTLLTASVNAIQPSKFAASVTLNRRTARERNEDRSYEEDPEYYDEDEPPPVSANRPLPPPPAAANKTAAPPSPIANGTTSQVAKPEPPPALIDAPVVHYVAGGKNVVVDAPYGNGKIIFLSDPFIVSNGGIALVDNAQLAINLVSTTDGVIAFDEYHQGFGANNNRFLQFFAGTPVVAIFFQCLLLVGLIFFSQSRRFARPVPEAEPDRLSKLEYVAAMAELQQRTRSYDLAIENIYRHFRVRASRLLGVDNQTVSLVELATGIAERANLDRNTVEKTMDDCEQIIFGEPTNKREVLDLATKIREIELALGLRRRTGK